MIKLIFDIVIAICTLYTATLILVPIYQDGDFDCYWWFLFTYTMLKPIALLDILKNEEIQQTIKGEKL